MKCKLLTSAVFAQLVIAGSAQAQDTNNDGVYALDEIVVTAQKRSQSVQDIGGSVSAISGDQLEALGLTEPADLSKLVPNFMTGM